MPMIPGLRSSGQAMVGFSMVSFSVQPNGIPGATEVSGRLQAVQAEIFRQLQLLIADLSSTTIAFPITWSSKVAGSPLLCLEVSSGTCVHHILAD